MQFVKSAVKQLFPSYLRARRERIAYIERMKAEYTPTVRKLCEIAAGRTFIDVGANAGCYSWHIKRHAKMVVAFEPIPSLARKLTELNPGIVVHSVALSNRTGFGELFIPRFKESDVLTRASLNPAANHGFKSNCEHVRLARLDDYELPDVAAIKIDVEGHEMEVIEGAKRTIEKHKPVLLVEIEERHNPGRAQKHIDEIRRLGYDSFYYDSSLSLVLVETFDFKKLQPLSNLPNPLTGGGALPYINDFLFLPASSR